MLQAEDNVYDEKKYDRLNEKKPEAFLKGMYLDRLREARGAIGKADPPIDGKLTALYREVGSWILTMDSPFQ